ncbi:MAG: serine hydrolase [Longimicrobiales bacterium]
MLRYLVEDGESQAIVLGILEADGSTRVVSYGKAGPNTRPLGPRSVFEIGSINKTFTGALLADMVAKKEVALTDPISKYLPAGVTAPSRSGIQITLLDLATHYSGLPRLPDNHTPADAANPYADFTIEKLYAFLSNHQLRRDPGAQSEYSNLGVGLLGHLLARAAGKSYGALLNERILRPLGMTMTGYPLTGEIATWMTKGHNATGDVVPFWFATEAIQGAGGLRSNMEDMLKYLKANIGAPQTDLQRAMRFAHEVKKPVEGELSIGLGWQIQNFQGRKLVMHGGGTAGFSTYIGFDPEKRVGFVMLTNAGQFGDDIGQDFLRRGPPFAFPVVSVPGKTLESYAGTYEAQTGSNISVRLEDDSSLTFQAPNNVRFRMYAESDAKFYIKRAPWCVTFSKDSTGAVTGLAADLEGSPLSARKVRSETVRPAVAAGNGVDDVPITAQDMTRYTGTYTVQAGARALDIRVFVESGRLNAQPAGQSVSRLFHQGNHQFTLGASNTIRLVFTVENGRAESVALHQGGGVYSGKRKEGTD